MAILCMRNASGHNYRNRSFIVDVAMGQIPRSTERISSYFMKIWPAKVLLFVSDGCYRVCGDRCRETVRYSAGHEWSPVCLWYVMHCWL